MPLDLLPILFIVASKPAPEKSLSGLQQRSASQKRIAAPELCESVLWTEKKEVSPACDGDALDVCIAFYWCGLASKATITAPTSPYVYGRRSFGDAPDLTLPASKVAHETQPQQKARSALQKNRPARPISCTRLIGLR